MRERDALMASIMGLRQDTPEWRDRANRELDDYRVAILREEAEKIRNSCPCYVDPDCGCGDAECVGKMDAADLIDPDVEK